jgi:UDP-glucose 4-epimerase
MISRSDNSQVDRIVVLGGLGFIGSHICRALVASGHSVRIFDKVYADRKLINDFAERVEVVDGDVARPDEVLGAIGDAHVIIHLIHTTVPGSSMQDPAYDVESNVVASVRWLSRLGETAVRRLLFVSSGGTVYGVPQTGLIDENHPTEPISSYGITKLAIEKYVALYSVMNNIQHTILRPSNVYGEGQRLQIGQGVIGVLADRALRRQPLDVWGTGESLRDYLYISDLVAAVVSLISYRGPRHIFNVSSGEGRSVLDILNILRRHLGEISAVTHTPARAFDVPVNVLDSSLLRAETGWKPDIELETGVARVLDWLRREHADEA